MINKFQQHIDELQKKIDYEDIRWDNMVNLSGYIEGFTQALKMVLERIEFIENNSDWTCETLKKEIKESIEIEGDKK